MSTASQRTSERDFYAVILAGGSGERFWPLSTLDRPKQFLDLERTGRSLLRATFERLLGVTEDATRIFVVTAARYRALVQEQLPELAAESLLVEPTARDTAPAIALAALELERRFGSVVMGLFPSDHRVADADAYGTVMRRAIWQATETRGLLTVGVRPSYAATGYGYIQVGEGAAGGAYRVSRFVEKPDADRAKEYLSSARYYWNSGMFLWRSDVILGELERFLPEVAGPLRRAHERGEVDGVFPTLPKISIDYAVLERTDRAYVIPGEFGWDDLGSWSALERLYRGTEANTVFGAHEGAGSSGNIVYAGGAEDLIVTLGVTDLVIVKCGDIVLVARKGNAEDVKQLMPRLLGRQASRSDR